MRSIQTEQYFPLYKFTWEKTPKYKWKDLSRKENSRSIKKWGWGKIEKKKKIQANRGLRDKETSIWLKINVFFMNWKISFKNSYSFVIFAKQVQRGLWTIKNHLFTGHTPDSMKTFSMLEQNWTKPKPLAAREERNVNMNHHKVWCKPGPLTHCS